MSDPKHTAIVNAPSVAMQQMHPVVAAAIERGATASELREFLALQREWEAGEARKAYTRAMVDLKRDLPTVLARDTTVDFETSKGRTRYKHTSLAEAVAQVTEPITQHGFSVAWEPRSTERGGVEVTCRLTHRDGHSEACTISAAPDTSGSKSGPQAVASTITLLERYTMLSILGIATKDMIDPAPVDSPRTIDPGVVDTARNLRAVQALKKHGKTRGDAEQFLDRGMMDWTAADIARLQAWVVPAKQTEQEAQ